MGVLNTHCQNAAYKPSCLRCILHITLMGLNSLADARENLRFPIHEMALTAL